MLSERVELMSKSSLGHFADDIAEILSEYGEEVQENLDVIVKKVGARGAKAVKAKAKASFTGSRYAAGWTSKTTADRLGTTAVIYNRSQPGLAHLLEHGHVSRNGTGRTFGDVPGREHIAPVEQELVENFQKELERRL